MAGRALTERDSQTALKRNSSAREFQNLQVVAHATQSRAEKDASLLLARPTSSTVLRLWSAICAKTSLRTRPLSLGLDPIKSHASACPAPSAIATRPLLLT